MNVLRKRWNEKLDKYASRHEGTTNTTTTIVNK